MTLSSPRTTAQFFDLLKFSYPKPFVLTQSMDVITTEGGRSQISMVGDGRWRFSAKATVADHDTAVEWAAMIMAVHNAGLAIRAYDFRRPYPKLDPTGSIIGANAVQIASKGVDNSSFGLKVLTSTYQISVGDYIEVTSSGNTFLFQSLEAKTAVAGVTTDFQVIPDLPLALAVDDAVNLKKPCARFIITPGSLGDGDVDRLITDGWTLEFEEE